MAIDYPSDEEVLAIITTLQVGGYSSDEINKKKLTYITNFYPGISDLIFHSNEGLSAEEILKRCKANKPILL